MPVKRRTSKKIEIDTDAFLCLLEREPENPFADGTESDWQRLKSEVLAEWTKLRPGTRPLAWWKFEAPEARRLQLSGTGTIRFHALNHDCNYRSCRGLPEAWWYRDSFDPSDPPVFESQAAYLLRLNLFLPGELERLNNDAFAPERIKPNRD